MDADQAPTIDTVVSSYLDVLKQFFQRLRSDTKVEKRMQTEALRRQAKLWACVIGLAYAVYGLFTAAQRGNAVFVLIIAGFTVITAWPDPGKLSGDLSDPLRLLFQSIKRLSVKAILSSVAEILRRGFRRSDGVVRFLLMAISVGGTAVVMKYGIRNFFLPDFIDIWVKRMGPAAVLIVAVLCPSYLISKRIFLLSMNDRDFVCRKYELCFYVSVLFLVACIAAFFVGLPFEDLMQEVGIDRGGLADRRRCGAITGPRSGISAQCV